MPTKKPGGPARGRPSSRGGGQRGGPQGDSGRSGGGIANPYVRYKKLERPPLEKPTSTLWTYPSAQYGKGRQGDPTYQGSTPSYVIHHFLSRWTQPEQSVLDPFCGSGTTLDVCSDLGRRGVGFDLSPVREDVGAADARQLPLDAHSVDHAFFDPPYADNLVYSDDEACIGKTRADDESWHRAMAEVADEFNRVVRPGGFIGAYLSDIMKPDAFYPLGLDLAFIFGQTMTLRDHICVVRNNQKLTDPRAIRKTENQLVRGFLHLLIFQRPADAPEGARRSRPPKRAGSPSGKPRRARPSRGGKKRTKGESKGARRPSKSPKKPGKPPSR